MSVCCSFCDNCQTDFASLHRTRNAERTPGSHREIYLRIDPLEVGQNTFKNHVVVMIGDSDADAATERMVEQKIQPSHLGQNAMVQ